MANVKVSELNAATTLDEDDLLCSVDTSDSETKKITYGNFLRTVPDGTAAAPSIANTGDTDTGILFPSDNTVAISCGGTQRFSVDGSGNVSISGTLTVSGSTTTIESTTLTVDDKNIELGSVASPSDTTADGGGITLKGATDHTIIWTDSTDSWDFSEHVNAASGKEFKIAGTSVLSATTLGSGVTSSSLTSVGTLGSLAVTNNITVGGTVDGRDLATDGTKLDGIESGATADQTASEILTAIKTVDGSGTGLDADLLDGVEASSFLRSDAADVKTSGSLRFDDSVKLELGNGSDLAIYHDGTHSYIDDQGTGNLILESNGGEIKLQTSGGSENLARFINQGAVELFYDNGQKLATKSDGIDVTGEVQCDSLDVDGAANVTNSTAGSEVARFEGSYSASGSVVLSNWRRAGGAVAGAFKYNDATTSMSFGTTTSHSLMIRTGDSDRLTIDSSGNVGIGATSPSRTLHVNSGATNEVARFESSDTEVTVEFKDTTGTASLKCRDDYRFNNSSGELVRIDSSGRLLVGTTSSNDIFQESQLQIEGSTSATASLSIHQNQSAVDGPQLILGKSRGSGSVGSSDILGDIVFAGNDGTDVNSRGAIIRAKIDGTPGSDDLPTHLAFMTTADGASSPTERMRVDSSGRLLLGTTTEGAASADNLTIADTGHCGMTIRSGTSSNGSIFFSDATSGNGEFDGFIDYSQSSRHMRFGTAQTTRLTINSNGAWGIEGDSNYGSSGQVLTSNGNDSPTWQDAASVSVGGGTAISMNDSVRINWGNSNDLQIYHDGSNSRINNINVGSLVIKNDVNDQDIVLSTDNGSGSTTTYVRCDGSTGEVQLTYYGTTKLNTKSDGVDITGELQCDSLDVDGGADINGQLDVNRIIVRDNGSSEPIFAVRADDQAPWAFNIGNDSYSSSTDHGLRGYVNDSGHAFVRNSGNSAWKELLIQQQNGNTTNTAIVLDTNRAVSLRYQGNEKLETKSDGVDITGELQCDSLDVDGSANITGNVDINAYFRHNGDTNTYLGFPADDTITTVTGGTQRFRITSTGALSIGSSNTAYGTSGQVLTSNGNAAPSWQDAGGDGYTAYAFATTERDGSITSSQGFASCTRNGTGSYTLTFSTAVGSTAYTVVIGNEDGDNNYLRRSTKASASITYTSRSTGDQARDMRQGVVVFKQ